ncbi:MAG: hypothetical protein GYA55_11325, partial [SAR324 cluster bacterium]|nr:hypothetical protein [SAR324 cluster bacterium]
MRIDEKVFEFGNFKLLKWEFIKDFNVDGLFFEHVPTGARFCCLLNDDINKVFSISFKTIPIDSKGIPHVLEHSVLCGSRDFPLRDPFSVLLKSSLNTYLNAFTSSIYTSYPVASQNEEDFKNLVRVYLDSVLHPLLTRETFLRQAWHFELNKEKTVLERKGVVLNEMRGRYAEADSIMYQALLSQLLPDTPYRFDAGGDPEEIIDLKHDELKAFHLNYYHPSNAFLYLYGNVNLPFFFEYIDSVFSEFQKKEIVFPSVSQSPVEGLLECVLPYTPLGEDADSAGDILSLAWHIPYRQDLERELGLALLSRLLYGGQAARLTRALVDSGLGQKPAGFGLFDIEDAGIFSAGLRGVKRESIADVETLIFKTLESVNRNPFPKDEVTAALNSFEFAQREQIANSPFRGMSLMHYVLGAGLFRAKPFYELGLFGALESIRKRLEKGEGFFEELCNEVLVKNPHRVKVVLQASKDCILERTRKEEEQCRQILLKLSDHEAEKIIREQQSLEDEVQTPESEDLISKVPVLEISAIDRQERVTPLRIEKHDNYTLLFEDLDTAYIAYMQFAFDLKALPRDLIQYLPLFMKVLSGSGAGDRDYIKFTHEVQAKTGGVGAGRLCSSVKDSGELVFRFLLEGSSLFRENVSLFGLMEDMAHRPWLHNKERCLQIARIMKTSFEESLVSRPISLVVKRSAAGLAEALMLEELTSGVSQLQFLRALIPQIENQWSDIQEKFERMRDSIFNRQEMVCNFTLSEKDFADIRTNFDKFLHSFKAEKRDNAPSEFSKSNVKENLIAPVQVSYAAMSIDLSRLGYVAPGSLAVVLNYLRDTWLWEQIRVQGGAYGAGCSYDENNRVLSIYSWDDPNPVRSLEVFKKVAEHLHDLKLSE